MTVTSRDLQVITGRAAREGARERVYFAQKPIAATKIAMRATQQPQRCGTTSCASRPSAGIDRAKRLISLKATGEQVIDCSLVASPSAWWRQVRPARPVGRHARGAKAREINHLARWGERKWYKTRVLGLGPPQSDIGP